MRPLEALTGQPEGGLRVYDVVRGRCWEMKEGEGRNPRSSGMGAVLSSGVRGGGPEPRRDFRRGLAQTGCARVVLNDKKRRDC